MRKSSEDSTFVNNFNFVPNKVNKHEKENVITALIVAILFFGIPYLMSVPQYPFEYIIYNYKFMIFSVILFKIVISYCLITTIPHFINDNWHYLKSRFKSKKIFHIPSKPRYITEGIIFIFIIGVIPISTVSYINYTNPSTDKYFHLLDPEYPVRERFYFSNPDYRGAASYVVQNTPQNIPVIVDFYGNFGYRYYLDNSWQSYIYRLDFDPSNPNEIIDEINDVMIETSASSFWYSTFWGDDYVYNHFDALGLADNVIGVQWFEGIKLIRVNF